MDVVRRLSIVLLLAVAATALLLPPGGTSVSAATSFKITYPVAGETVNRATLIIAEVDPAFPRSKIKTVSFRYSANGTDYKPVRGQAVTEPAEFGAMWDTGSIAQGNYYLRAELKKKDGSLIKTKPVRVFVNSQPSALITGTATGVEPRSGRSMARKIQMNLNANGKDPGGTVTSIEWDFGDGTTGTGPTASHSYQPGEYDVSVTVKDDKGGTFTSRHHLVVTEAGDTLQFELKKTEKCGCKSMTIKTEGNVEGPDHLQFPFIKGASDFDKSQLGPWNGDGTDPNIEVKQSQSIGCRFEVIADLHPGSAPEHCAEGVRYQSTNYRGTKAMDEAPGSESSDPRYDSSKSPDDPYTNEDDPTLVNSAHCDYEGETWCDGGYHGGQSGDGEGKRGQQPGDYRKGYLGNSVYMAMMSGDDNVFRFVLKDGGWSHKAKYEATVSGPDGTCKCTWEVRIVVDATGRVIDNRVLNVVCTNS